MSTQPPTPIGIVNYRKSSRGEAAEADRQSVLKAQQQEALRSAAAFIADREAVDAAPVAAPARSKDANATTGKKTEKSKVGP